MKARPILTLLISLTIALSPLSSAVSAQMCRVEGLQMIASLSGDTVNSGEPLELLYDDGTAENSWWKTEGGIGGMFAVLFTPPDTVPCQVISAKFFVEDRPAGFVVQFLNESWARTTSVPTVPTAIGWHEVDLSTENVVVSDDFVVAMKYTEAGSPCLGIDQSGPDGRSYSIRKDGSVQRMTNLMAKDGDWMIRVVVKPLDTDGDGLYDYYEREIGTDPSRADSDGDGLTDMEEFDKGTSPVRPDTDEDGLEDAIELDAGTDPLAWDTDADGLSDRRELDAGTDPLAWDTDADGLSDRRELDAGTDPLAWDTDADGLSDGRELHIGTDPLEIDTDGDELNDKKELELGTSPLKPDTDEDFWNDPIDLMPTNRYMPNSLIVAALAIVALGMFVAMRRKAYRRYPFRWG